MRLFFYIYCIFGAALGLFLGYATFLFRAIAESEGGTAAPSANFDDWTLAMAGLVIAFNVLFVVLAAMSGQWTGRNWPAIILAAAGLLYLVVGPTMLAFAMKLRFTDGIELYLMIVAKAVVASSVGWLIVRRPTWLKI